MFGSQVCVFLYFTPSSSLNLLTAAPARVTYRPNRTAFNSQRLNLL
jgi:hypothetical protein